MTVVQISDYLSPRKTPLREWQRLRNRVQEVDWGPGSRLLIACAMILAWVVVFIVMAGVGSYLEQSHREVACITSWAQLRH